MELIFKDHPAGSAVPALNAGLILAMCRRAFGPAVEVLSARELGGGTFNSTFLVRLKDQPVILRIAPAPSAALTWDEQDLMRREQQILPYFAPLAALMPRTLMADFTHQLLDRDYVFQSYLEGERWDEIDGELTQAERLSLWRQFGALTAQIHQTAGAAFGGPAPAAEFARWSEALFYRFERTLALLRETGQDVSVIERVYQKAREQAGLLDEIAGPRLLHGDLWLFNLLVRRGPGDPEIVGVLDPERAWWGDPPSDWTMFVLAKSLSPETEAWQAAFWQGYGPVAATPGTRFRQVVYETLHIGNALAWAARHGDEDTLRRGAADLAAIATELPGLG